MEECTRCGRNEKEVRLIDTISDTSIVKMCDECASMEGTPVIRKPSTVQLKESEKNYTYRERTRRASGMNTQQNEDVAKAVKRIMNVTLDDLRRKKEKYAKQIKTAPWNLMDNYNWKIIMARKNRKMSRGQLARSIGESETAIRMAESKELPDDGIVLIKKIEQFFGIRLRKDTEFAPVKKTESQELKADGVIDVSETQVRTPVKILKFDEENLKNITIGDIHNIKKEKEKEKGFSISDFIWGKRKAKEATNELVGNDIDLDEQEIN